MTYSKDHPYKIAVELAGIPLEIRSHFPEAALCFSAFEITRGKLPAAVISVSEEDWSIVARHGVIYNGMTEASLLTAVVSDALLDHGACMIHGAAFCHRDKAWIITGQPGVGKSTQVKNLQELEPDGFQVICGDRPALRFTGDTVMVCPSPWNGKEGWHGAPAAPLEGIICLTRGEGNSVSHINPRDAALPVFTSLIQTGARKEGIRKSAEFTDALLQRCDTWSMTSCTIPDSSRMLYEYVFQQEGSM